MIFEIEVDICTTASNPCMNGALCNGSYEEDIIYTCNCLNGWQGKNCSICNSNSACLNGGTCNPSSGICICAVGYSGTNCGTTGTQNKLKFSIFSFNIINSYKFTYNFSTDQ